MVMILQRVWYLASLLLLFTMGPKYTLCEAKKRVRQNPVRTIEEAQVRFNYTFPKTSQLKDYGTKKLNRVRFLHIPKTGTLLITFPSLAPTSRLSIQEQLLPQQ